MNISSRQLEAVVQLARHRSFTQAAARMHLTQAGLSAMIGQVETQLNARLFERTTRSVMLSEAGRRFLPAAERMLAELAAAVADTGLIASQTARRLRVGVTPFVAASVLPAVLRRFALSMPGASVHVADDEVNRIQSQVADGLLDVAFGSFFTSRDGVRRKRVLRAAVSLARVRTSARQRRGAEWRALDAATLIALPDDNPMQVAVDRHMHTLGVAPSERRTVNHIHTALALVEAGEGVAVLPSYVQAATAQYRIELAPLRSPGLTMDVYRMVRAGRGDTPEILGFADCFVQCALELGYMPLLRRHQRS